jgi:hypothetical protein
LKKVQEFPFRSSFPLFSILSKDLFFFSLDLVKIVHSYLVWAVPEIQSQLVPLFSMRIPPFNECYGMGWSPKNEIWLGSRLLLQRYNMDGMELTRVAPGEWTDACGVAFDSKGTAYISDYGSNQIVLCNPEGVILKKITCASSKIWFLALDREERFLFVTTTEAYPLNAYARVVRLTLDGNFLDQGWNITTGSIRGIAINSTNEVAIVHTEKRCVEIYDCNGIFSRQFGSMGCGVGQFEYPYGIAVDRCDHWFVSDVVNQNVQVFQSNGTFITRFSAEYPRGVCIDGEGRLLVSSLNKVTVFGFQKGGFAPF